MSLVNKMLLDLESRSNDVGGPNFNVNDLQPVAVRKSTRVRHAFLYFLGFCLLLSGVSYITKKNPFIFLPMLAESYLINSNKIVPADLDSGNSNSDVSVSDLDVNKKKWAQKNKKETTLVTAQQTDLMQGDDAKDTVKTLSNDTEKDNAQKKNKTLVKANVTNLDKYEKKNSRNLARKVSVVKLRSTKTKNTQEQRYASASQLLKNGRLAEAEASLKSVLKTAPFHIRARESLASLLTGNGRWDEAQRLLQEGIMLVPEHRGFEQQLARIFVGRGKQDRALALLERGYNQGVNEPEYVAFLAALYQRQGHYDDATKVYQQVLTQRPEMGKWWLGLGLSYEGKYDWIAAQNAYRRALDSKVLSYELTPFTKKRLAEVKRRIP